MEANKSPRAKTNLGDDCYSKKDDAQALICYQKAANQDHTSAQYVLGLLYDNGRGCDVTGCL